MTTLLRFVRWLLEPTVPDARVHPGGRYDVGADRGAVWLTIGDDGGRCRHCVRLSVEDANRLSAWLYSAGVAAAMHDVDPAAGLAAAAREVRS